MRKKKTELISELKTAENLLLEKHEELLTCQDELSRIITEQNRQKTAKHQAPTSPNSFKLDIFPHGEDPFQSKIEHLLSRESQPLDGLDLDAIVSFISTYIPIEEIQIPQRTPESSVNKEMHDDDVHEEEVILETKEEETPEAQEEETPEAQEEETPEAQEEEAREEERSLDKAISTTTFSSSDTTQVSSKEKTMVDNSVSLSSAVRLHTQVRPLSTTFHPYTPFDLEVSIDPKVIAQANLESGRCKISIFSKNLSKDSTTLLGVLDDSIASFEKESIQKISAAGLPQGFYRIEVVSTFTTLDGNTLPIASVNAGSFIHVT